MVNGVDKPVYLYDLRKPVIPSSLSFSPSASSPYTTPLPFAARPRFLIRFLADIAPKENAAGARRNRSVAGSTPQNRTTSISLAAFASWSCVSVFNGLLPPPSSFPFTSATKHIRWVDKCSTVEVVHHQRPEHSDTMETNSGGAKR
ncbi:hypothetical protein D9619_010616 [Psilocybe cf. subviscida]|uniref:Uncharacterized protein n=1 Tax=Psilocybe cf. subviscida TaxID=2480587 RepID=A0A8H5BA93_9AGAR|nr:hypothetical protein D9619_010616 [Psilocybe cf. subviscida]